MAYESDLLVVNWAPGARGSKDNGTDASVKLCGTVCGGAGASVAVNLSIGNSYGSHEGNSLLETFINTASNFGRTVLVTGTGNEAFEAVMLLEI